MQSRVPSTERKVLECSGCYIVRNVPVGTHVLNVPVGTHVLNVPVLDFVRAILAGLYCMYKGDKPNNPKELMRIEWRPLRGAKGPECSGKKYDNVRTLG